MTKKEKEELERKQKKNSKAKSLAILILVVLLIAVIAFFLFKEGIIPSGKEESSVSDPANSVSDTIDYSDSSNSNNNSQTNENKTEDESSGEEPCLGTAYPTFPSWCRIPMWESDLNLIIPAAAGFPMKSLNGLR